MKKLLIASTILLTLSGCANTKTYDTFGEWVAASNGDTTVLSREEKHEAKRHAWFKKLSTINFNSTKTEIENIYNNEFGKYSCHRNATVTRYSSSTQLVCEGMGVTSYYYFVDGKMEAMQ